MTIVYVVIGIVLFYLVLTLLLVGNFPTGADEFAVSDSALWFGDRAGNVDIRFSLGLDGLSLWLFGLTSLLMILAVAGFALGGASEARLTDGIQIAAGGDGTLHEVLNGLGDVPGIAPTLQSGVEHCVTLYPEFKEPFEMLFTKWLEDNSELIDRGKKLTEDLSEEVRSEIIKPFNRMAEQAREDQRPRRVESTSVPRSALDRRDAPQVGAHSRREHPGWHSSYGE